MQLSKSSGCPSFLSAMPRLLTHTNMRTHCSGVTGPWWYERTLNTYIHGSYIHQHGILKNYICVPFWTKHLIHVTETL